VLLARVAVPVPLGQAFSYEVPEALASSARRGARVVCEFGRRRVLGVVLDVAEREPDVSPERIKPIAAVADAEPVLPEELLSFLQELARYYVSPIGEVIQLALPAIERSVARTLGDVGRSARVVGRGVQVATATGKAPERMTDKARALYDALVAEGPTALSELEQRFGSARAIVRRLSEQGALSVEKREQNLDPFFQNQVERDTPPELTPPQAAAVEAITHRLESQTAGAFLLDGVTASGKTEVYLRAVERCLWLGKSAVVLVPEIALTPQLVSRFRARIGDAIAVLHSALGEPERHAMWRALRSGSVRVAVGARSALFAPVPALGLICVDEEHDGSFKQEEGVRYNARDMALLRAHRAGATAVLGSATPSLGSSWLVQQGRLERLKLPARARAQSAMPDVEIVDLRRAGAAPGGERLISVPLYRELEALLERKQQAILFLNRRGFAPSLICDDCGQIVECPNCSVALTLHRSRGERLVCHYCDYTAQRPVRCASCGESALLEEGAGTERIEKYLTERFPDARVERLDRDVASGTKGSAILERMRSGKLDILVGTQMVTKGHDLPNVTLVGVLNADAALSMPDFRAAERSFQLLVQVAGRAGRGDAPGRVLIQTRKPQHPAIVCAAEHDVTGFVERELEMRKELEYPPFSRLVLVRCDAVEEPRARDAAQTVVELAQRAAGSEVKVLGPAPAPIARLRNRYRFHVMIRARERSEMRQSLLAIARRSFDRKVRVAIDVDPVNML
jgi:primosomal protein N' (replication factor Y)